MILSLTRFTGIFASLTDLGRGKSLLSSQSMAFAIEEGYDHRGYGVHRDFFKRVNHSLNLKGLLINAESERHKPSGRYAQ